MQSIQSRLATGLFIALFVLLSVQWIVVGVSIRYLTEDYIATRLEHDSESLLRSITIADTGTVHLDFSKIDPVFNRPFSGHYYKIVVHDKVYRSRSLWDTDLPMLERNTGQQPLALAERDIVDGPQLQVLLLVKRYFRKKGYAIVIVVAEDLTNIRADILYFQVRYGIISVVVFILLLAIQSVLVKRNLRPLEKTRQQLASLEQGVIKRLNEDVPSEILPLVKQLNQQLNALNQRLERSRNATGNLAHALKTQLTLLSQIAHDLKSTDSKRISTDLAQAVEQIQLLINRELKRGRIAGAQFAGEKAKLDSVLMSLVTTLRRMYSQKSLNIHYQLPAQASCKMDKQDLMEMLGNVLDNACKWAKHEISITIQNDGDGMVFEIADDGPGCSQSQIQALTVRGVRLDEKIIGHGLGLSIVQDIVNDYSGQLEIIKSADLGGLSVKIQIP